MVPTTFAVLAVASRIQLSRLWRVDTDTDVPVLTTDQLQELVDEAKLGAISVDTNVFHRFGYNLEAASLLALAQFPAHGITHLVTDVVSGEVRMHMVENEAK